MLTYYSHNYVGILGAGLGPAFPPVPGKLVQHIEQGCFIELGDLLPECLGYQCQSLHDESSSTKPKRHTVSDIVEWLQCFGTYTAIISLKSPSRVLDLLGYQNLILHTFREFKGDVWLEYDRCFRQQAAAIPSDNWAVMDSHIWNFTFSGRARVAWCSHCFSPSHTSSTYFLLLNMQTSPQSRQPIQLPPDQAHGQQYFVSTIYSASSTFCHINNLACLLQL